MINKPMQDVGTNERERERERTCLSLAAGAVGFHGYPECQPPTNEGGKQSASLHGHGSLTHSRNVRHRLQTARRKLRRDRNNKTTPGGKRPQPKGKEC